MRVIMGVLKSKDGVYYVRKKVPAKLEEAVSRVLGAPRQRVSWLKRSLRTKDLREANIRAKPALIEFDRTLARAAALLDDLPKRNNLSDAEIERIADYHYARILGDDEDVRRDGTGSEELYQSVANQLAEAGVAAEAPFAASHRPAFGLSNREMEKLLEDVAWVLPAAKSALAKGDVSFVHEELEELLDVFRINLDRGSHAYRQLGAAILRRYVRALQAIEQRNQGEAIETPRVAEPAQSEPADGGTLTASLEGWKKAKQPPPNTSSEFDHAVRRFVELHGDLPIADLKRSHVREFREALQQMPVRRTGSLRTAVLPELVEWSRRHSGAKKISPATVNKLLGGVQAVAIWGRDNGLVPDDVPWSDPFSRMRLEEDEPLREPWDIAELQVLFSSPVFVGGSRPAGGRGEAAYWLPLLGLFTGARQGELAPLRAGDVTKDEETGIWLISITEDEARGTRLKTASSRRVVPVHPELVKLGFLEVVSECRTTGGKAAPLFPLLTRGPRGSYAEGWSKWFGRYIRSVGLTNRARVFHSFRHGFKDALRRAGVSEDLNDALTGHSGGGVGRSYGAKDMERRFGLRALSEAVVKVHYRGLDLSHLRGPSPHEI